MSNITTIKKGEYKLNSSLKVIIDTAIEFSLGKNYILTGENGIGKSSFITNLLIPNISPNAKNNFLLFYASQDITIQYYVVKNYYNGLLNEKQDLTSIEKAIKLIKTKYLKFEKFPTQNIVFILDEIDQYLQLNDFFQELNKSNYSIFLATHNENIIQTDMEFQKILFKKETSNSSKIYLLK